MSAIAARFPGALSPLVLAGRLAIDSRHAGDRPGWRRAIAAVEPARRELATFRCAVVSWPTRSGSLAALSIGICDRLAGPVLVGIIRPLILLPPAALSGWSVEQIEMVLLHELAHLRRWDNLVNLVQRVIESLLFFHPVVWWLSGWVRLERELCCDRLVVERLGRPFAYVEMLVAVAGSSHGGVEPCWPWPIAR